MPRPLRHPWSDAPSNIWWTVQIMQLLITQFYSASCHFFPLGSKYSHHPVLKHPQSETSTNKFTTIIGYSFTLPCQSRFGSMEPSSVAVYLHTWFKHYDKRMHYNH
jgi:hypothetical protein